MQELNRLIISCGGTGGHFNPGLSTACAFRDAGGKPLLILGGKHLASGLTRIAVSPSSVRKKRQNLLLVLHGGH